MAGTDDFSQLMPRLQQQAQRTTSENTEALREYMMAVDGRNPALALASVNVPRQPRRAQLKLRPGTGRVVQPRPFTIRISREEVEVERQKLQEEAEQLDPQELKHALLQQARQQRRAVLQTVLHPGGTRPHVHRPFKLVLDPVVLPEPEPQPEAQPKPQPELPLASTTPGAAFSSGVLQERQQLAQTQLACAKTPASLLLGRYTPMEGVPERLLLTVRPTRPPATVSRSLRQQSSTPFGFTPVEGIPERLVAVRLLTGQCQQQAQGGSHVVSNERSEGHQQQAPLLPPQQDGVESPVEGLVQEGARRSSDAAPAPLDEFAFVPAAAGGDAAGDGAEGTRANGCGAEEPSPSGRSPGDFLPGAHFWPGRMEVGVQTGLSLKVQQLLEDDMQTGMSLGAQPGLQDQDLQTGNSLDGQEEDAGQPEADMGPVEEDSDAGGGVEGYDYDDLSAVDGGDDAEGAQFVEEHEAREVAPAEAGPAGELESEEEEEEEEEYGPAGVVEAEEEDWLEVERGPGAEEGPAEFNAPEDDLPGPSQQPAGPRRRQTMHPGVRLRNELGKRKSLARSDMGMREVAPGLRRSMRQRGEPLMWWLNESKLYNREHTTLPTIKDVKHVNPNTPWRVVADHLASFKRRKKAKREPTPHELELEGEAAEETTAVAAGGGEAGGSGQQGESREVEMEEQAAGSAQHSEEHFDPARPATRRQAAARQALPARGQAAKSRPAGKDRRKARR